MLMVSACRNEEHDTENIIQLIPDENNENRNGGFYFEVGKYIASTPYRTYVNKIIESKKSVMAFSFIYDSVYDYGLDESWDHNRMYALISPPVSGKIYLECKSIGLSLVTFEGRSFPRNENIDQININKIEYDLDKDKLYQVVVAWPKFKHLELTWILSDGQRYPVEIKNHPVKTQNNPFPHTSFYTAKDLGTVTISKVKNYFGRDEKSHFYKFNTKYHYLSLSAGNTAFSLLANDNLEIELYDKDKRFLYKAVVRKGHSLMPYKGFPAGEYYLLIKNKNNKYGEYNFILNEWDGIMHCFNLILRLFEPLKDGESGSWSLLT